MRSVPTRRPLRALLTFVVLALCGVAFPATTANAKDTVGIAIAPVNAAGKTDGRSRFSYQVDPGQTITDHVRVSNAGTTPLKVTVFATDAFNDADGGYALLETAEKTRGAGSWVKFNGKRKLEVTLARGQSKTIPFTVTVPKNATPGDHAGGVVASATTDGQLTVERRIANRMYVRVSGDLQPNLTISSISGSHQGGLNPADGSVTVNATVTNSGNVALEGVVTLSGSTWFGIGVGQTVRRELPEILPGNTATVAFELEGVPQAGYAVVAMLLQSGVSGDAPDPGPLPVVNRDVFVLAVPWLLVAVLLLGVGGWFFLRWRRRRDEAAAQAWIAQTQAEARQAAQHDPDLAVSGIPGHGSSWNPPNGPEGPE